MATLLQQPNEFNLAVGPNVWVLDNLSSATNYILGIEIDGNIIATIKQTPNPSGVGIFEISQILQSYLSGSFVETTQFASTTPGAAFKYRVRYGTQTGTSVPTWNGYSDYKIVINGYKNFNELDWVNQDLYVPELVTDLCGPGQYQSCPVARVNFLTTYPDVRNYTDTGDIYEKKVYLTDWHTLSWANFHQDSFGTFSDVDNKSPWAVKFEFFDEDGILYEDFGYFLIDDNGMPIRTDCTSNDWLMTDSALIGTIGVGPKNLIDAGFWPTTDPKYYRVTLWTKNCDTPTDCEDKVDVYDTSFCIWAAESFEVITDCSKFEPIQLSFMNEFGVRDYYTFTKRNTLTENITRNNFQRDAGTWSASSFSIQPWERGEQTFNTQVVTNMTVSTDWLTDDVSKWLERLFVSPDVKIWYNDEWRAVTLTSTTYNEKTVARDNKMFRHELSLQFSQNKRIQRGS